MPARLSPPPAEQIPGTAVRFDAQCDASASGAEDAQVRVARHPGESLYFCAHHAAVHGLALIAAGWRVTHDNRR